jgi:hypothetical protein
MAEYKTTDFIIQLVLWQLSSISKPKYLGTTPDFGALGQQRPAEYIVINSLPINADVMQKCIVNVNYHVKDIGPGLKDQATLEAGSVAVLNILKLVTATAFLIDFERQETIAEPELGEHYSNMRFSFKYINN